MIIFGGSFDPIHNAHIAIANYVHNLLFSNQILAMESLNIHHNSLSLAKRTMQHKIYFIPNNGNTNYKTKSDVESKTRIEMLRLVVASNHHFALKNNEIIHKEYRPTFITLQDIYNDINQNNIQNFNNDFSRNIYFIIGSDSLLQLDTWENWQQILELSNLIVIPRDNFMIDDACYYKFQQYFIQDIKEIISTDINQYCHDGKNNFNQQNNEELLIKQLLLCKNGVIYIANNCPLLNISATMIRSNLRNNVSIAHLVPKYIDEYIKQYQLY